MDRIEQEPVSASSLFSEQAWGFRLFSVLLFLFVVVVLSSFTCSAAQLFVPGRILVKPKEHLKDSTFGERLKSLNAREQRSLHRLGVRVVQVPEGQVESIVASLRNDPDIEFAEPDYLARIAFVPNDPYVVSGSEWHLAKIQAPQAWDQTTGNSNIIVAVLDTGINFAHREISGQVLPGYDFVNNDADPSDDMGHGTAVAGTIVAAGNNSEGVAGVAYGCRVLPVKVADSSGLSSYSTMVQGIRYAVDHGARIINISIAGETASAALQSAVDYAWTNKVLVIAAAGNGGNTLPQYPGACDHAVAVAATEPDDSLALFSSRGAFITIAAPGDNIWTTQRDLANPYASWRGTSFASPIVAGVAALVVSANASLANSQVVSILKQTADDLGTAGTDATFGAGRVNAFRAVLAAFNENGSARPGTSVVHMVSPETGVVFAFGSAVLFGAAVTPATGTAAITNISFFANAAAVMSCAASNATVSYSWIPSEPGNYSLLAVASDNQGLSLTSAPVSITVSSEAGSPAPARPMWSVLTVQTNGAGRVAPNLNGRSLQIGRDYTLRAVRGPGQVFAGWQGAPADSDSPVLRFVMESNLTLVASFVPNPFPPVKGSYAGLAANTNGVTPESSGYFRLSVTTYGAFTGKLLLAGTTRGFHGHFNLAGDASVTIYRAQTNPFTLFLHTDLTNPSDVVAGRLTDGAWDSAILADRNVFDARWRPAEQAGLRSFALERSDKTVVANGSASISQGGGTRIRGKLQDNRAFASSGFISKNGDYPFFLSLHRGTEIVIGWLNFPAQIPSANGTVLWVSTGTNAFSATLQAAAAQ